MRSARERATAARRRHLPSPPRRKPVEVALNVFGALHLSDEDEDEEGDEDEAREGDEDEGS